MKEGWRYCRLGDICRIERGGSPRPIKQFITHSEDGLNWIKIGDTDPQGKYIYSTREKIKKEGLNKSRWVEENEFLLSNSMSFGRPYILKTNGCIHDGWLVLRDYQNSLFIDFFYYMLISPVVQKQFRTKAQGSTVSNLNTDRVSNVNVSFPTIDEQQRIVEYLDKAFEYVDLLKDNSQKQLDEARKLFQAALTEAMQPKEGWETKKIKDISDIKGGKRVPKGYKLLSTKTEHPYIRVSDFTDNGSVDLTNILYISDDIYQQIKNYTITDNDIYISIAGTIGKSGIIPSSLNGANLTENACKIVFKAPIERRYFYLFTLSDVFKKQIEKATKQASQPKLALTRLAEVEIYLPSIAEQVEIVQKLDALSDNVQKLEEINRKVIVECDALKQSILRQIFE